MTSPTELPPPTGKGPILPGIVTPLQGSVPHALFYDLTHDNESPLHKRSAEDALSTGALVAFSHCAVGSVKGFDDLYPKLLDLVGENRHYEISAKGGIGKVKRILNHLHTEMALEAFEEAHVHQENDVSKQFDFTVQTADTMQYIVLHRIEPKTQRGYLLVAHTAFHKGSKDRGYSEFWFITLAIPYAFQSLRSSLDARKSISLWALALKSHRMTVSNTRSTFVASTQP